MPSHIYESIDGATFADPNQQEGSRLNQRTGIVTRIATNGAVRLRAYQSANKSDPTVIHWMLTSAQLTSFKNFYTTNRAKTFYFKPAETGTYLTCVFSEQGYEVQPVGGSYNVTVYMREA